MNTNPKDLEVVERGIVLSAQAFDDENINETWKVQVRKTDGSTVSAYAKLIAPREVFIESVCAIIGRYLGIKIPKPILVILPKTIITKLEANALGFASEDAEHPSIRRTVDHQAILDKIRSDVQCFYVGVFDEWIANPDRHIGNILYDGSSEFWFIDHGLSIPEQLAFSTPAASNILINHQFKNALQLDLTRALRDANRDIVPTYYDVPLSLLSGNTYAVQYVEQKTITDIVDFLSKRIDKMSTLLAQRIDIKQMSMRI